MEKIFAEKSKELLYEGSTFLLENTILAKAKEQGIRKKSDRYKSIVNKINYFKTNEKRMKYHYFENRCFPIGSGVIEGACKHVVQIRMKRNGMVWSTPGANDVLQLRCLYLSNRGIEVKNVIENMRT